MKINIGDKFYRVIEDDKIEIIRIVKEKPTTFIILDEDKQRKSISKQELDKYTKLKPDAYITFSIVTLEQGMKDIIVSMHRRKDIDEGIQTPYAACRQNILDIFANQIMKEEIYYIGCSVSIETCPADVDYNIILSCNGISKMYMVSAYIDDIIDNWLELIPVEKFDNILNQIFGSIVNANLQGYCKSLKELLDVNCFIYDFHKGFNIDKVPFELKYDTVTLELDNMQTKYLEDLYRNEMFRTYVIKYTKEIDLNKIQRYYVMVSDTNNDLYIVAYDRGEYINRIYKQQIKDKRDAVALLKYKKQ